MRKKTNSETIDRKTDSVNMLVLNTLGYFKDHTDKLCENIFYIFFLKFLILKSTKMSSLDIYMHTDLKKKYFTRIRSSQLERCYMP